MNYNESSDLGYFSRYLATCSVHIKMVPAVKGNKGIDGNPG